MDKPSVGRLNDLLRQIDEGRNAHSHAPQPPSDMVTQRNARLASQANKIAALKRTREAAGPTILQQFEGETMARKRELIDTGTDKRYIRRNKLGTSFVESDDVGRSLAADRRQHARSKVQSGQGDKGDHARPKTKRAAAKKKAASRKGTARKSAHKKVAKRR